MLEIISSTDFVYSLKGKSVNTEFYPLTRRKETIPENSDFLGTEFSVGLSLSFYSSYFRAQKPLFWIARALHRLSGFLLLFPFVFLDFMMQEPVVF